MDVFKRSEYTKLVLEGMQSCYGIEDYKILIHAEPDHPDVIDVIRSFTDLNIELTINDRILGCGTNTFNCLSHGFSLSDFVIHIEDDIVPAKDCLRYFEWARDKYANDKTVWDITSYCRPLKPASKTDFFKVDRIADWFCPWGWATWIDRWEELREKWNVIDGSWGIPTNKIRGNRFEIRPSLGRTQNIGAENGVNVESIGWHKEYHFNEFWVGNTEIGSGDFYEAETLNKEKVVYNMNRMRHIQQCRICGNNELTKVFDLGYQYLQGSFCHPDYPEPSHRKIPLELLWCNTEKREDACGALQLSKTIPPSILYSNYWYMSGITSIMKNNLKSIVDEVMSYLGSAVDYKVLDIAANDGTLLSYYPKTFTRVAIDPSNIVETIEDKSITTIKGLFPTDNLQDMKFNAITSIAVLYDLNDPMDFIYHIEKALNPDGVWIFEMSYMPSMFKMNAFDTICGEHIFYYSLSVIEYMLEKCNMKLINAELNDINGGSIRCTAVKMNNYQYSVNKNIDKLRMLEFEMGLDTVGPYKRFEISSRQIIYNLRDLLYKLVKNDKKVVHLYGASTKGNTLLQVCGIDNSIIPYAAERSSNKWGAHTLGSNIQIISEEESRAMKPDYYLVLPWHFKSEFLIREKETINSGISFIFPLPDITIVNKDGESKYKYE